MKLNKLGTLLPVAVIAGVLLTGCDSSGSLGQVNGKDISNEQFDAYLKVKRINIQDGDTDRYQKHLQQYIQREALVEAISQSELLDQSLIQAEVNEFRKQVLTSRYFETYLGDRISDQGIQNFYSENVENYQTRKVNVAHILLRVDSNMDESQRQAVLTTAHEVYSKLRAGEDFSELAKEYSQDKVSAKNGGSLGWISEGAVSEAFSERAFSSSVGEVAEPFLTTFGFHIIKVLQEPQIVKKPLQAVKGDIRYQMRSEAKKAETKRLLESIDYEVKK